VDPAEPSGQRRGRLRGDAERHPVRTLTWRTTFILAVLTVCYFLLPSRAPTADPKYLLKLLAAVLALVGFAWVIRGQLVAVRTRRSGIVLAEALLTSLYLLIIVFATIYYFVASRSPDQFDGIADRMDSLYFTVTVISTVGFGDIHAVGTFGRALVTGQMIINLIYVGTALRLLSSLRDVTGAMRSQVDERFQQGQQDADRPQGDGTSQGG
jgi:hypothetical protein